MPRAFTDAEQRRIRAGLLAAGREAIATRGFRRTTVGELTRAAGISKGAFYLFYPDKTALIVAVLHDAEAGLRAELDAVLASTPPQDQLQRVFRVMFDALSTHPLLRALADPEDLAWLVRSLPAGALEAARDDDRAWFGGLYERLVSGGAVAQDHRDTFVRLPGVALAMAAGRSVIDDFDAAAADQVRLWTTALAPRSTD